MRSLPSFARIFLYAGWIVAVGLALVLAYLFPRVHLRIFEQPRSWETALRIKKEALAERRWADPRPLSVWVGDSHIEMGNWYNGFDGSVAVRNCGMSMATIKDIRQIVGAIPEKKPNYVVVMCGINSLFRNESVEDCLQDYRALIHEIRDHIEPRQILVLSVMPVRQTAFDSRGSEVNGRVKKLNAGISLLSKETGCEYLDVTGIMSEAGGGLACQLTSDGLHLNAAGYRTLVSAIRAKLIQ